MEYVNYILEYMKTFEDDDKRVPKRIKNVYKNLILPVIEEKDPKYIFDIRKGSKPILFIEKFCRQSKAPYTGKKIKLLLFQKAKLQVIYGIVDRETGQKRFKEVFDIRGRKNGKSTENSATSIYSLLCEEAGQEIYCCATDYAQSRRVWDEALSMVNQDKDLRELLSDKVFPRPEISYKAKMSKFMPLSKNINSLDGLNASLVIIDEVHNLARNIYDLLKQSTASRKGNYLISMITTAGFVRGALFDDIYEYAKKVADGVIVDESFLPLLYTFDNDMSDDEVNDKRNWYKANPSLGEIKSLEELTQYVERMKNDLNFAPTVKTKDFNIIGVVGEEYWLGADIFYNNKVVNLEDIKDKTAIGGFDLSQTGDLTAFTTMYFKDGNIICETMYWCTAKFLKDNETAKINFRGWIDTGYLRISGDNKIDYHDIANYILEQFKKGVNYQFIMYDSWSAQYLIDEISSFGYAKKSCLRDVIQGFKTLSIPMQTLEGFLRDKKVIYQNNPITTWCFSNVILVKDRNGNWMPDKSNYKKKIDGVATILNCMVALCENLDYFLNLNKI